VNRILVLAVSFVGATLTQLAQADILSEKTSEAKIAWDNAKQITADAEARRKEKSDALVAMRKDGKLGKFQAANLAVAPPGWCDPTCVVKYNSLRAADGSLNLDNFPEEAVLQAAIDDAGLATAANLAALKGATFSGDSTATQKAVVLAVCLDVQPPAAFGPDCKNNLTKILDHLKAEAPLRIALRNAEAELSRAQQNQTRTYNLHQSASQEETLAADKPAKHLADRLAGVRRARCATAYCWGGTDGREYAIEPALDLPIGMYWSAGGGALANYVNANNIKIHASAGLRFWLAYDVISLGVLLAQPELTDSQKTIDFRDRTLSTSQLRRPYPTLVVGIWGDIVQLSVSYDELRNASRNSESYIPDYAANAVLSRTLTLGVALNPVTAARNGIGASVTQAEAAK
jgi:hypothetical protein